MAEPTGAGLEVVYDPTRLPETYNNSAEQKEAVRGGHTDLYGFRHPPSNSNRLSTKQTSEDYEQRHPPRICGLSPLLFGITISLTTAIIVGAAIGGGLGAALANSHHPSPTQTITTTITTSSSPTTTTDGQIVNYQVAAPSSVYSVPLDCPNIDGRTYTSTTGQTWAVSCTLDQQNGDFDAIVAYTYEDCIEACSTANFWQGNSSACIAVQFDSRLARTATASGDGTLKFGNCFLKGEGAFTKPHGEGDDGQVSAKLVAG